MTTKDCISDLTRRTCLLSLGVALTGCSQEVEAMVRMYVPDRLLRTFNNQLVSFARARHFPLTCADQHLCSIDGWGMRIDVSTFSRSADGRREIDAFFYPGMILSASSERIEAIADALVAAMNSIDGITAVKEVR